MAPRAAARPSATILQFPDRRKEQRKIVRITPETDGLCLLYSHHALSTSKLFAVRILCWGLQADGEVVALLPWLNRICRCRDLERPETGRWEGYYDARSGLIFDEPPEHKELELNAAARFFGTGNARTEQPEYVVQEIPDTIGSHAAVIDDHQQLCLHEVSSWRLFGNGDILAMLPDPERLDYTPVLPGDKCLYAVEEEPGFRYFFQYHIANQIKSGDPVAVRALTRLIGE